MAPRNGIDERLAAFQDDVITFIDTIVAAPGTRRVVDQLVGSAGGAYSNRLEATSASSKKEFIRFNEISLREAKESGGWLRACKVGKWGNRAECERLLDESRQIANILAAIIISSKRRRS